MRWLYNKRETGMPPKVVIKSEMDAIDYRDKSFITLALFVHGYAGFIVNNLPEYDTNLIVPHLERIYTGAILVGGGTKL